MLLKRGRRVHRSSGLPFRFHGSWLPAGVLACGHLAVGVYGGYPLGTALALGAVTTLAASGCVVLHSLGHELVSPGGALGMTIYPFGEISTHPPGRREASSAAAGIVVSAILGGIFKVSGDALTGALRDGLIALAVANFSIAALNLLPGLPLDGGRILTVVLRGRWADRLGAVRAATWTGQAIGVLLFAAGVGIYARQPSSQLGWAALWLGIVGISVLVLAFRARLTAPILAVVEGRSAGYWAHPFAGRVKIDAVVPAGDGPFAVSDHGRLAGIAFPEGAGKVARDVMVRWTPDLACSTDDPLSLALERMIQTGTGAVVVLDGDGVVQGVLSERTVRQRLIGRA